MAIQSMDQLISALSAGNKWRADWNKNALPTTAQVTGQWYDLFGGAGNPGAATIYGTGTNLVMQSMFDYSPTTGSGIQHGGDVAPSVKQILNASVFSAAATTAPAVMMLVDVLAYVPITTVTTTGAQSLIVSNTVVASSSTGLLLTYTNDFGSNGGPIWCAQFTTTTTLPTGLSLNTTYYCVRQTATTCKISTTYANAKAGVFIAYTDAGTGTHTMTLRPPRYSNGAGVQAFLVPSTVMGAATPNFTLTYTNATTSGIAGTASRATPSAPALPACNTGAPVGSIVYAGTGAGKYGPFIPLQAGDQGIQTPTAVNLSATYASGVLNLVLCRPLLTLPITTVGVASERDLINQLPSAPIVYDGACLNWLMYAGALTPTNSAFYGNLDFAWG